MHISIATYNIHKGVSQFFHTQQLSGLRRQLGRLDADLLFLQEVCGESPTLPSGISQYEFLAQERWHFAYGKNAVTRHGNHGNALLSRYPIVEYKNHDISAHWLEQRGMLHCVVEAGPSLPRLHCLNLHLGLLKPWRIRQLSMLVDHIKATVPADEPMLIAGDFNDWNRKGDLWLSKRLDATDVFTLANGRPARTFPSFLPVLPLDRIYARGLKVKDAEVRYSRRSPKMSDHAALAADLELVAI